jgi:hypothetical protein
MIARAPDKNGQESVRRWACCYGCAVNDRWLAWVRIGFALLTLGAIAFQASTLIGEGIFNPTRFFLFFTILSNLLASAVFLEGGRRQLAGAPPVPDLWRGLAVVAMTITSDPRFARGARSPDQALAPATWPMTSRPYRSSCSSSSPFIR